MAHYAFLDSNNMVTEVIVGRNETEVVDGISDWETHYGTIRGQVCKRTSYNANIRKRFAGIGFFYSVDLDMFIEPKPYPSWTLDVDGDWQAPVQKPFEDGLWQWHEDTQEWTR
jgi:hypothetical protein